MPTDKRKRAGKSAATKASQARLPNWKGSEIRLTKCQIKSIEIARAVAEHLDNLEAIAGIRTTRIVLVDCFVCPDLTAEDLDSLNRTPMERHLRTVLRQLRGIK